MFDRFEICEAYWFYGHNFGNYSIINRLFHMGFRMSPIATLSGDRIDPYLNLVAKLAPDSYHSEKFDLVTKNTNDYRRLKVAQLLTRYN